MDEDDSRESSSGKKSKKFSGFRQRRDGVPRGIRTPVAAVNTLPTGDALTSVLQYHVLGQEVKSTAITAAVTAETLLAGKSITAAPESG